MTDWFALRTAPREEKKVEARLKHFGVNVFLPTELEWRRQKGRRKPLAVVKAKIPGYLFITGCSPWDVLREFRDRGVKGVVGSGGQVGRIPHEKLEIYAKQSATPLIHSRAIVAGRRAELIAPGCEHVVVDVLDVKGGSAKVLMWLLGAKREVEVKLEHLMAA
jgi:transcription antitermination factor NusG